MRRHALVILPLFLAFVMSGCGGFSTQAKQALGLVALGSQERAVTFAALSKIIGAKEAKDEAAVQKYLKAHVAGLASDAKAFSDFIVAVADKGDLTQAGKSAIADLARGGKARAENWAAMAKFLQARGMEPAEWDAVAAAHGKALDGLANAVGGLADALKDKEDGHGN